MFPKLPMAQSVGSSARTGGTLVRFPLGAQFWLKGRFYHPDNFATGFPFWLRCVGVEIIRQKKLCAEGKLEAYLGPATSQPLGHDGR